MHVGDTVLSLSVHCLSCFVHERATCTGTFVTLWNKKPSCVGIAVCWWSEKHTKNCFEVAPSSRQASVNTLHIWEGSRKGLRQRPTLMPFEMPQLSSAVTMNDHRQQQTDSARQMLCCPNREYVNRVQWPATWNCWIIQVIWMRHTVYSISVITQC